MKIFGYMRVSMKDKQSSNRQLKALKDYANQHRFKINEFFEDKISGIIKTENRKQYLKLKSQLRNKDVLIITDLDR
jgi:DNA invertase Pin-like site-specific DNA recombinase